MWSCYIWQEVFKGKIVDAEKITSLSANEYQAATFFSSEESNNYVRYLEATGKGCVAHDYLKYDSLIYQDILTSLAICDEDLSGSIKGLSSNNTTDTEAIETKTKLIDDTQNLYEKKALEYSGIAGIAKPQEIGTCYAITNNYGKHLYLLYKNENIQSSDCTYFLWSCYILNILHVLTIERPSSRALNSFVLKS